MPVFNQSRTRRAIVLFATRDGQTRKVAEHLGDALRARGVSVDVGNVAHAADDFGLRCYDTAILAGSLRVGGYERELIGFARQHREALSRMRASFVSVSLSEAGAEDATRSSEARARFAADVEATIQAFEDSALWRPTRVKAVAGALAYTKYNPLLRLVMKHIAARVDAPTDTSRDFEFTDWSALDRFATEIAADLNAPAPVFGDSASLAGRAGGLGSTSDTAKTRDDG